ncbi:glycosyltransferase family 2 protein [Echinicola soli]|uniref:Glycosyltransferase family 2 protein n=1 Tax=Echinicola soli TaxID=2591634 RepID=A0A514CMQ8_9BACT|nr:glycosyltransferase family A protein [Echinicola soli]QDH81112.1 glycosyltransferase family 2 protein [Echinicola soli]
MKTNLFIPTLNAGKKWHEALEQLTSQALPLHRKVIIDSGSTDGTLDDPLLKDFDVISIDKKDFDHGGTRQMAVEKFPDAEIFIFLTQDAIPAGPYALSVLVAALENNPKLGMAYGRQLPHHGATTLESHARLFNYPKKSEVRSLEDRHRYGIKTISCSNSFAAYRKTAFFDAGGFPRGLILGEDAYIAGKMLLKGWEMAYIANAQVHHSHDYTVSEEFKRYFDIGVFHADSAWIFDHFGRAEGRGLEYLQSEIAHVLKHDPKVLPKSIGSLFAKWSGYKIGLMYKGLPTSFNKFLSMHKHFWHSTQ